MRGPFAAPESDWRDLKLELCWCYEGEPLVRKVRVHGFNLTAWMVLEGEAMVRSGGRTVRALPGEWLVSRPMERWQNFADSTRILSIHLALACPALAGEWSGPAVVVLKGFPGLRSAAKRLASAAAMRKLSPSERCNLAGLKLSLTDSLEMRTAISDFARRLLAALEPQGMRFAPAMIRDERVRASRLDLSERELAEGFSRDEFARGRGVSPSQLDRLWRIELKMTPRQYWEKRRLEAACERLQNGPDPIKALAYELGFSHQARFSVWFRDQTGQTPREFRLRQRRE